MPSEKTHQKPNVSPGLTEYANKFDPEKLEGRNELDRIFREIREIIKGFLAEEKIIQISAKAGDKIIANLTPPDGNPEIVWTDEFQKKVKARWSMKNHQALDSPHYIPRAIRTMALEILSHVTSDHNGEPKERKMGISQIILGKRSISLENKTIPLSGDNEKHLEGIFYAVFAAIREEIETQIPESGKENTYSSM